MPFQSFREKRGNRERERKETERDRECSWVRTLTAVCLFGRKHSASTFIFNLLACLCCCVPLLTGSLRAGPISPHLEQRDHELASSYLSLLSLQLNKKKYAAQCSQLSKIQLLCNTSAKTSRWLPDMHGYHSPWEDDSSSMCMRPCVRVVIWVNRSFLSTNTHASCPPTHGTHTHIHTLHTLQPHSFMNGLVVRDWLRQHIGLKGGNLHSWIGRLLFYYHHKTEKANTSNAFSLSIWFLLMLSFSWTFITKGFHLFSKSCFPSYNAPNVIILYYFSNLHKNGLPWVI